jgi:hypothetical protein
MPGAENDAGVGRYRRLELCSGGGGFEALPVGVPPLDLVRVRKTLEQAGVPFVDARVLLVVTLEIETTLSRSGRLLFKTRDERAALRAFAQLRELLSLPPISEETTRRTIDRAGAPRP